MIIPVLILAAAMAKARQEVAVRIVTARPVPAALVVKARGGVQRATARVPGAGEMASRGTPAPPPSAADAVAKWGSGNNWPITAGMGTAWPFIPRFDGCDEARRQLVAQFNAEAGREWSDPCDFNRDGTVNSQDFFDFLTVFNSR